MSWQIIHDDDVAATEGWCEALLDVREEDGAVHRSINQEGSDNPVVAQAGDECDCFQPSRNFSPSCMIRASPTGGAGEPQTTPLEPEKQGARLIASNHNGVTFRYKDYRANGRARYKVMTLGTHEFASPALQPGRANAI